jgi:predicted outer membrane repeat protein
MRYLIRFWFAFALSVMLSFGCSEGGGEGGSGGTAGTGGIGGMAGTGGIGGTGGSGGSTGQVFACTEQGIRDAIALGGGPQTFDCDGPTTVVTEAEIVIDEQVTLDGEGKLTVDGNGAHRVFVVEQLSELRGLSVTGGLGSNGPAGSEAGGIYNGSGLTLKDCTVSQNDGNGIYNRGSLTLVNSIVSGNVTSSGGGGIYSGGDLTLIDSIVSGNTASQGGGIASGWGTVSLTNSTISDNEAENGGGIWNYDGTVTLTNSLLAANTAFRGGGFFGESDGHLTLNNSTVSGNFAYETGGGIWNRIAVVTLVNSTVSGNTAVTAGDGISSAAGLVNGEMNGMLKIIASTVLDDVHANGFAALFPSIEIASTVIQGRCVETGNPATWTSGGYNIESPGDTCGFDPDGTDLVNVTAEQLNLGPLADNGGSTMTHALLTEPDISVAIDRIDESACEVDADQRGVARPQGLACDVGAFELEQGGL